MRQPKTEKEGAPKSKTLWSSTPVANMVKHEPSGRYYARLRVRGKLIWKSLGTDSFSVAKQRLPDFVKEHRQQDESEARLSGGKMFLKDCTALLRQRVDAQQDISEGAKVYRRKCIDALNRTWPELATMPASKVTKDDCLTWAGKLANLYSPSVYNNTVGTLQMVIDIAVEKGARFNNPAKAIGKRKPTQKKLALPSPEQFQALVREIETAGAWCSKDCGKLVRFLAFGGFRKSEAAAVTWADCDFERGRIHCRITKNGEARFVPMIPEMKVMLEVMRKERAEEPDSSPVMKVQECQKAVDNATKRLSIPRMTHHDFRHLFATRCIEMAIDIPTVSRWLGHKDGGALMMRTYGHLRDQHSQDMAAKVSFAAPTPAPANVIPMAAQA